ncbi:MAG: TIGR00730 family Rossman fold protein [Spirochaetales bacterium]|nr:TIGR00730 family Rossman fold protein [Spirochaetales bacterium]
MKTICVFCGSSKGNRPDYLESARNLGAVIAERKYHLVYGGSQVGLMAATANAALSAGGEVSGVITEYLQQKVGHTSLSHLYVVKDMHERKMKMFELSDAFIALPGGIGTFEEILEIMTWAQLGLHAKPFGFLNTCGYYDKLSDFLDYATREGFVKPEHRTMVLSEESPETLLDAFMDFKMPNVEKWIGLT